MLFHFYNNYSLARNFIHMYLHSCTTTDFTRLTYLHMCVTTLLCWRKFLLFLAYEAARLGGAAGFGFFALGRRFERLGD